MKPDHTAVNKIRQASIGLGLQITIGLVGLHVTYYRHAGPLWRDEVTSANVAALPSFAEVFANMHLDSFPAAWVTVLHLWTAAGLGDTDAGLRMLGLLIGLATVAVLWWSGWRLGVGPPLVALVLFGMSPTTIIYGDEVRGYGLAALGVIWSTATLWAFAERPSWKTFAVAQAAAILAVQTHYGNCFLLLGPCAGAAAVGARRRTRRTVTAALALGATAAATMLINVSGLTYNSRVAPIEQGHWSLGWLADMFQHAVFAGVPALGVAWALVPVLAAAGCFLAWRSQNAGTERDRALLAAVTGPVALSSYFFAAKYVARLPTQYWYYLPLMAVLALSLEAGIALLARRVRWGETARIATVAAVALLSARSVAATVAMRMTNIDLIASKVQELASGDDLIVVVPWHCGITFRRYYGGSTPWITLPDFAEHKFHRHLLVAEKMRQGDAAIANELERIERTLRGAGRVWLVGIPPAPPAGEPPPRLPPAPTGPQGWRAAPYLDAWELQLGALLQTHGRDTWRIHLPDVGPVNTWENLSLVYVEGWQ